ncbi:NmrA family NAD(P)-binding protein, partial [bacterium]|nr:NmrA family NAD(P)-binding protein [bacterium]
MAKQQTVAVIGSSGQIGYGLSRALLKLNHRVVGVTRKRSATNGAKLSELESLGAVVKECGDYADVATLADILKGCDTVVVAMRANAKRIRQTEPRILEAALNAGVKRFVPD